MVVLQLKKVRKNKKTYAMINDHIVVLSSIFMGMLNKASQKLQLKQIWVTYQHLH